MCGIFGILDPSGISGKARTSFNSLSDLLRHRGPDGTGLIETPTSLIGMHRLGIMDPSGGQQPFTSESGRFSVVSNGEIYNYPVLRQLLKAKGYPFRSGSDMEVIPHLLEEYGLGSINHLRGMFAIAIVDRHEHKVHLVRDRLGEKPLIVCRVNSEFWFASELTALLKAQIVDAQFDPKGLELYLSHGFVPEDRTIIQGVQKLRPGTILTLDLITGSDESLTYWDPNDYIGDGRLSSEELGWEIGDAVSASCQSDVPVAISLSGGMDSSLVASLAQKHTHLHALTVGYEDTSNHDESQNAIDFAKSIDLPITRIELKATDVADGFSSMCQARDEPISDIAGSSVYAISVAAQENGFPVLLNGQGGDELFWGYPWVQRLAQLAFLTLDKEASNSWSLKRADIPRNASQLHRLIETGFDRNIRNRLQIYSRGLDHIATNLPLFEFQPGYRNIRRSQRQILNIPFETRNTPEGERFVTTKDIPALYIIKMLQTYLRSNGLAQTDRLTMRCSVEARTPLVDHKLVELILSRGQNAWSVFSKPKRMLREFASNSLPETVINRPKRGFTPPVREWNSKIWLIYRDAIMDPMLLASPFFNRDATLKALGRPTMKNGQVNQMGLRLLTLELWYRGIT